METAKDTMGSRRRWAVAGALVLATALTAAAARIGGAGNGTGTGAVPAPVTARRWPVSFTGQLDRSAVLVGGDGVVRMELVLAADAVPTARVARTAPTDLIVILDRSGSMSGDKIEHARRAVRELVAQLGTEDRFALVTYSDQATLALPLTQAGARDGIFRVVDAIHADGSTNMSSGIDLALDTVEAARRAGRVPRAILISDGLANVGDPTPEGLTRRAGRAARGEYVLSTVGVGADFNEYLMTALADAGTGNYYYLRGAEDLGEVFAREFNGARTTVASGLALRIAPAPGVRVVDAAGYPLESVGGDVVVRPGALAAGQERRFWLTLAVPHDTVGDRALGRFAVDYDAGGERVTLALADEPRIACVAGEEEFYAGIDRPAWTRSMVNEAYGKLQEDIAREVKAGRRDEAKELIRRYRAATAPMNDRLKSAPVAKQLESLDKLEADVGAVFTGPNAPAQQNVFSKRSSAEARDQRRAGAKN